jgi:hypothetical protein
MEHFKINWKLLGLSFFIFGFNTLCFAAAISGRRTSSVDVGIIQQNFYFKTIPPKSPFSPEGFKMIRGSGSTTSSPIENSEVTGDKPDDVEDANQLRLTEAIDQISSTTFDKELSPSDCIPDNAPIDPSKLPLAGQFKNCFKERKKQPLTKKELPKYQDNIGFLKQDQRICACQEQTYLGGLDKPIEKSEVDERLDEIEANLKSKSQVLSNMSNGMMIQVQLLTSGHMTKQEQIELVPKYKGVESVNNEEINELKKHLKSHGDEFSSSKKRFNDIVNSIEAPDDTIKFDQFPLEKIPTDPKGSCFSMKTFFEIQMKPNRAEDKEFINKFLTTKDINSEEWDLEIVKRKYDEAISSNAPSEQVQELRSRIVFIKKNPLYANLFSSKSKDVKSEQKKLLGILKDQFEQKFFNCSKERMDRSCLEKKKQQKDKADKEISEIFKNPDVFEATRERLNDAIRDEYGLAEHEEGEDHGHNEKIDDILKPKLPLSQTSLESRIKKMTNESVDGCYGPIDENKFLSCSRGYLKYCQSLNKAMKDNKDGALKGMSPSDDLIESIESDFSINPKENKRYKELVDEVCNNKHYKGKQDAKGNMQFEEITFQEFKEKYLAENCGVDSYMKSWIPGTEKIDPGCENQNDIISQFIKEFPLVEGIHDPGPEFKAFQDSLADSFAEIKATKGGDYDASDAKGMSSRTVSYGKIEKYGSKSAFSGDYLTPAPLLPSADAASKPVPAAPGFVPFAPVNGSPYPSAMASGTSTTSTTKSETKKEEAVKQIQNEKKQIQDDIVKAKEERDQSDSQDEIDKMNERIRHLEELLSKKDKEFKDLEDRLKNDKLAAEDEAKKAKSASTVAESSSNFFDPASKAQSQTTGDVGASGIARGPASVGGSNFSGALTGGGATLTAKALTPAQAAASKLNQALLEKYGISVNGSTDGSMLVASERDRSGLLLLTKAYEDQVKTSQISAVVSKNEFEKFKNNDLTKLTEIYNTKVSKTSTVVKLQVLNKDDKDQKESLEFYAIREGDKVIFQPVRKTKLNDLKLALPKT